MGLVNVLVYGGGGVQRSHWVNLPRESMGCREVTKRPLVSDPTARRRNDRSIGQC